jgi:hypothetical protein
MPGLDATAQVERFRTSVRGGLAITGNTLGLSKAANQNGPGLSDGIGTFTSVDPGLVDDQPPNLPNPWFAGTTPSYAANSSRSHLQLPPGAYVLHAELVWGGSHRYGSEDVGAVLDQPVLLTAESAAAANVTPDPATAVTLDESGTAAYRYYVRSANVTTFVRAQGAGAYTVSGVPGTQDTAVNVLQAAGWALLVAYADALAPLRTLAIAVDGRIVDTDRAADTSFRVSTPPAGAVEGRVFLAALEGDASRTGDRALVATEDGGAFVAISGPNNPADNFFASQINDGVGVLDATGTFGDRNHDALAGSNVGGGRQGWDVTGIPLAQARGEVANGQADASVRVETTGDEVVLAAVGFEVTADPNLIFRDGFQ